MTRLYLIVRMMPNKLEPFNCYIYLTRLLVCLRFIYSCCCCCCCCYCCRRCLRRRYIFI